jgi:hypothetical protein
MPGLVICSDAIVGGSVHPIAYIAYSSVTQDLNTTEMVSCATG